MDNLIIEIGAETKDFLSGLAEVADGTSSLGDKLGEIGTVAGVAFAAYTAAIMGTVYAYRQEELVGQEMRATLQATGSIAGVTSAMINELAESFSKSTTFSKLQVEQGEAMLLTFDEIGKNTFPAATQAVLDLAQHMGGDAAGAAQILGKALQDPMLGMKALTKAGVRLTAQQQAQVQAMELAGNMAGAQGVIIQAVEDRYGHMAQAAAGGTGQISVLKNAMEALAVNIGEQFAPAVSSAAEYLTSLITWASQNPVVMELAAGFLAVAAAGTGLVTAVVAGVFAFEKLQTAMSAARVVMTALGVSTQALVGATGIGLLLIATYEIYEHWNAIWPAMQAVYKAFVDNISNAASGLYKVLTGSLSFDMGQIKAGLAQVASAFSEGAKAVGLAFQPKVTASPATIASAEQAGNDTQAAENRARLLAARAGAQELRSFQAQALRAEGDLAIDEAQHYSTAVIALKKKEIQELKSLADAKFQGDKAALKIALAQTQAQYAAAFDAETALRMRFNASYLANDKNFQALSEQDQATYIATHEARLVGSMENETAAKETVITQDLQRQIKADNTELEETVRYGAEYAAINKETHTLVYQNTESALNSMSQMTQSKNSALAAIGKAASVMDIEMKGIQAALNVYAGFCTIPIIGPELGIAAAAATIAYTQEQAAKVLGLSEGGLITGGIPGVDSVPALMQQGELAVPKQNFEEVVGAVASQRNGANSDANGSTGSQKMHLVVEFKGDAARLLQVRNLSDQSLGIYRGT